MTERVLIGRIDITDNIDFFMNNVVQNNPNLVLINLDEDNLELKSIKTVLGGMELLPPPEALMAEVDGDEQGYDYIYNMYYEMDQNVNQYITALIAALYRGLNIIMYYPTLDPSETKTIPKLIDMFWKRYGIGIGILGLNDGMYDLSCTPIWLKKLYMGRIIGPIEFLAKYPSDAILEDQIMTWLLQDIRPCCDTLEANRQFIISIWKHVKEKPDLKIPFTHV